MEQILWAVKAAPVADVNEWAVLVAMSEAADQDGTNSFLSVTTISRRTRLAERTVQRRIGTLEERGLLRRGDQTSARMIPADRRPVVYDLQVPYSFFRPEKSYGGGDVELSVNIWRAGRGRAPLTPQERPDLTAAPEKGKRADKGVKRADGVTTSHPVDQDGVTTSHPRGDYKSPHGVTTSHPTLSNNPPHNPPRSAALRAATAEHVETSSSSSTIRNASASAAAAAGSSDDDHGDAPRAVLAPSAILEAMRLNPDEAARFRAWLVTATNAKNPDGLIVTLHTSGRLSERLEQWRVSETFTRTVPGSPSAARGHLAWCGDCDHQTRTAVATDAEGREYVRRCLACNVNASPDAAVLEPAVPAVPADDELVRDAYEAARAARAALPAGVQRRRLTIGTVTDIATVRAAQMSDQ